MKRFKSKIMQERASRSSRLRSNRFSEKNRFPKRMRLREDDLYPDELDPWTDSRFRADSPFETKAMQLIDTDFKRNYDMSANSRRYSVELIQFITDAIQMNPDAIDLATFNKIKTKVSDILDLPSRNYFEY